MTVPFPLPVHSFHGCELAMPVPCRAPLTRRRWCVLNETDQTSSLVELRVQEDSRTHEQIISGSDRCWEEHNAEGKVGCPGEGGQGRSSRHLLRELEEERQHARQVSGPRSFQPGGLRCPLHWGQKAATLSGRGHGKLACLPKSRLPPMSILILWWRLG